MNERTPVTSNDPSRNKSAGSPGRLDLETEGGSM